MSEISRRKRNGLRLPTALGIGFLLSPLFFAGPAVAKCAMMTPPELELPEDTVVPTNVRLVVERFHHQSESLRGHLLKGPLELVPAAGAAVSLQIESTLAGEMYVEQAVLKPAAALTAGATYQLKLQGAEPKTLRVGATADHKAPVWDAAPKVGDSSYQMFGCGPDSHVAIKVPVRDDGPVVLVRAAVRPLGKAAAGARTVSYLLRIAKGEISLGHSMCSGPFVLRPHAHYEVTLTAVDLAGNETPAPGGPLSIVGPVGGRETEN